jgi:hypothetical protein
MLQDIAKDVLHTWGYQATRRHSLERLVGAQRHAAASTNSHGPWGALESWVPFSEELVEAVVEDSATNLLDWRRPRTSEWAFPCPCAL